MTPPKKFLGRDPSEGFWLESHLQMFIAQEARRAGYRVTSDVEGKGKSGGSKARAMGRAKGEPDLRFYLPMGRVIFIELKKMNGVVSEAQEEYHAVLTQLGFMVRVVFADTPVEAWEQVKEILEHEKPQ